MAGNWVKVYRSLMDSAVWHDEWLVKLWIWCLMKANHSDGSFRGTPVKRGEFITGRNTAADELGVTPSKWYRGVEKLSKLGNITLESNNSWTKVSVCNYKTYQDASDADRTADEQRTNSERTADEQRTNTIEEEQEQQEGKNTLSPSRRSGFNFPQCWSDRCAEQWELWQTVRKAIHHREIDCIAWQSVLKERHGWDEQHWFDALVYSTGKEMKHVAHPSDHKPSKRNGKLSREAEPMKQFQFNEKGDLIDERQKSD